MATRLLIALVVVGCGGGEGPTAIIPADNHPTDRLGEGVGISNDTVVVGAPYRGESVGAAYVFEQRGDLWVETQTLMASTPRQQAGFGSGIAIDGDDLIVGGNQTYAFARVDGAWVEVADFVSLGQLGSVGVEEVALDGGRALLDGDEEAHLYVREATGWRFEQTIRPSDTSINDMFGSGLALSGDTALVGAQGGQAAYVFDRVDGVWTERQKLIPPTPAESYGWAVAIEGDLAVVGGTSSAFVYRRTAGSWQLEQALGQDRGFCFGCAVEVDAGRVVVSAWGTSLVEIYEHDGAAWNLAHELHGPAATAMGDGFGFKLAIEGGTMVASSVSGELGATYVVELP